MLDARESSASGNRISPSAYANSKAREMIPSVPKHLTNLTKNATEELR